MGDIVKKVLPILIGILAVALAGFVLVSSLWFAFGGGWFMLAMANIGHTEVVQAVESPNGTYLAELINDDQGALGGNTLICVYKTSTNQSPQYVYRGEWGEFDDMTIYWKDDRCLVVKWETSHHTEEYIIEPW